MDQEVKVKERRSCLIAVTESDSVNLFRSVLLSREKRRREYERRLGTNSIPEVELSEEEHQLWNGFSIY